MMGRPVFPPRCDDPAPPICVVCWRFRSFTVPQRRSTDWAKTADLVKLNDASLGVAQFYATVHFPAILGKVS